MAIDLLFRNIAEKKEKMNAVPSSTTMKEKNRISPLSAPVGLYPVAAKCK
jgi:hypothetical protein